MLIGGKLAAINLDDWQKEIIEDESQYILLCKGRQIGGTTTFAKKAAKRLVRDKGLKILVGSITEDQAKLVIVMVRDFLERDNKKMICTGQKKPTQERIQLTNGAEIRSRPVGSMGDAFRGFTGGVAWFNEMSKWPELAFASIMPSLLTTGGDIWADSTPFGKKGYFYKSFENKEKRWKVYYKSSEDAIHNRPITEHWTEAQREKSIKFLEDQKRELSTLQYGQEYLGLFLEDLQQFFDDALIEKTCVLKRERAKGFKTYLGCDLALMGGDQTTWEIIEKIGQSSDDYRLEQRENITQIKMTTPQVVSRIIDIAKIWDVRKVGIDCGAGTIGVAVMHFLLLSEIKRKVVALNNRDVSLDSEDETQRLFKEDMYFKLRALMESNVIKLLDDEELKLSLKSIQMEIIKEDTGKPRMRVFSNFGHICEGIVRAVWLATEDKRLDLWAR